jgi:superfamily II DNA or RNA helicase
VSYALVDEQLEERLTDPAERHRWLLLDIHPEFSGHWRVNCLVDDYKYDLAEALGPYRAVSPAGLEDFRQEANEQGYEIAFFEDPMALLEAYDGLNEPPLFALNSSLPNTVQGMLPYQVQGFNFLKDLRGGVARWDTGTGKTVLASALVKYHQPNYDFCFFVVKKNNKVNTVRKLLASAGVESILVAGPKYKRKRAYERARDAGKAVLVMNYEQFQYDFVTWKKEKDGMGGERTVPDKLTEWGEAFFEDRDVMCIWDEMPMKLKTRMTRRYMAVCHCLYKTKAPLVNWDKKRPKSLRQYMLSATPIEKDPEDWFNCVRILDPEIYGNVVDFRDEYVARYSYFDQRTPEDWHKLDKMALKAAHIVHQVDKSDPDIAAVFPETISESLYIDWNDEAYKLYSELEKLADKLDTDEESEALHILSLINLFQMICDAPSMIHDTAAKREIYESALEAWEAVEDNRADKPDPSGSDAALAFLRALDGKVTNKNHAKLDALRSLIAEVHPDEKICVFTKWNAAIMPTLEAELQEWGIEYVRYDGSDIQKQAAQDAFQNDPEVRVFLSSDAGSDSIDLDAGSVVVHYDLPWKWTTYIQRENRVHRATSQFDTVWYYTLLMADSIEERVLEIIMRKRGFHDSLFKPIAGLSASARLTKEDFRYVLTGSW